MSKRICIIQGHPHGTGAHFCHALAGAYARGAEAAGAEVETLDIAHIAPRPLGDPAEFETEPGGAMAEARAAILRAEHLVIVFPVWLGTLPAALKAFFEQMARANFALGLGEGSGWPERRLKGRSARIVATMGMPAVAYRLWYMGGGVAVLARMVLGLAGVSPVRRTLIGGIGGLDEAGRERWLERMEELGRRGL